MDNFSEAYEEYVRKVSMDGAMSILKLRSN